MIAVSSGDQVSGFKVAWNLPDPFDVWIRDRSLKRIRLESAVCPLQDVDVTKSMGARKQEINSDSAILAFNDTQFIMVNTLARR